MVEHQGFFSLPKTFTEYWSGKNHTNRISSAVIAFGSIIDQTLISVLRSGYVTLNMYIAMAMAYMASLVPISKPMIRVLNRG